MLGGCALDALIEKLTQETKSNAGQAPRQSRPSFTHKETQKKSQRSTFVSAF